MSAPGLDDARPWYLRPMPFAVVGVVGYVGYAALWVAVLEATDAPLGVVLAVFWVCSVSAFVLAVRSGAPRDRPALALATLGIVLPAIAAVLGFLYFLSVGIPN